MLLLDLLFELSVLVGLAGYFLTCLSSLSSSSMPNGMSISSKFTWISAYALDLGNYYCFSAGLLLILLTFDLFVVLLTLSFLLVCLVCKYYALFSSISLLSLAVLPSVPLIPKSCK